MKKTVGYYLIGGAVVAGFLYAMYRLAQPNTQNINNVPNSASTSTAVPFNNLTLGSTGLVPLLLPGDISNTDGVAQTNPGVV